MQFENFQNIASDHKLRNAREMFIRYFVYYILNKMTLLGYSHSNLRIALTNGVNKVNVPQPRTNYFKNSFSYSHGGAVLYTCQLFLRYRREIFILGVLGFLKTTRSFPKIPEEFRSLPKKSEVFRRCPKSSKFAYCDESENSPRISQSQS